MHTCPVCHRTNWFTDQAVAEHVDDEHAAIVGSCTKKRWRTEAEALDVLIRTARRPNEKRREHRRYACPKCGGYHLTSQPVREDANG